MDFEYCQSTVRRAKNSRCRSLFDHMTLSAQPINREVAGGNREPTSAAQQLFSMAVAPHSKELLPSSNATGGEEDEHERIYNEYQRFVENLPRTDCCFEPQLYQHPDQWYANARLVMGALAFADHFKARPSDILLATRPKSGTTWLKALLFLIANRIRHTFSLHDDVISDEHPFVRASPHELVPFLELQIYRHDQIPADLDAVPSPRLYATHVPFRSLPATVKEASSGCRIVYLCRNPLDTFVSYYHFWKKVKRVDLQSFTFSEFFEDFISGHSGYGSYWGHVLEYWNASKAMPRTVLFLKYEEMRKEPEIQLKKLAEFVGYPFTEEEEVEGVVEKILRLSSFEHLSNLEVNKSGVVGSRDFFIEKAAFFRKGEVGDCKNHLTPEMTQRLCEITREKFQGTGLDFQIS